MNPIFTTNQLQITIIISLVIMAISQSLISIFSIFIMKRVWIKDNKLLRSMKMECNSSQDIQFSSGLISKTTFMTWAVKVPLILYVINILINISFIYFYNGKTFKNSETLLAPTLLIPLVCWFIQVLFSLYIVRLYTIPLYIDKVFNFSQSYRPNIKNKKINIKKYPLWIRFQIKTINKKKNLQIQALLIASKYNAFSNESETKEDVVKLFDYIIINQK